MASSGSYNMSSSYGTIRVEWWLISQSTSGNYSRVGWRAVATWASNTWLQVYSCNIWVNGAQVLARGGAQTWGGQFASGELNIGHNSNGTKNFGSNGNAAIYTAATNASGSGSWDLPTIPRNATMTDAIGDFNDESAPWFDFSNPAGASMSCWIEVRNTSDSGNLAVVANRSIGTSTSGRYTWTLTTTERDAIRAAMTALQTTKVRIVLYTNVGGDSWSYYTRNISIINATPEFSEFSYKDSNAATVAITGNDQFIIQGQSTLQATILAADKMIAKKSATAVRYRYQIGGIDVNENYSTSDVVKELGVVGLNTDSPLIVTAVDSRNLTVAAQKMVNILPYLAPQLNPTATRVNNFETSTKISVAGVISRLTIAGVDKNAVNTSNGLQYRYKKTDTGTWGSWQNITSSTSGGNVSMTDFYIDLDRNFAWNVEFRLADKITTTSVALLVGVGIPIFRIGTDGSIYNNEVKVATINDLQANNSYKFSAYKSASSNQTDNAMVDYICNTERYDPSNMYNPTTGVFTVPFDGYWFVNAQTVVAIQGSGSTSGRWLWEATGQLLNGATVIDEDKLYLYAEGRVSEHKNKMGRVHYLTAGATLKMQSRGDTNDGTAYVQVGSATGIKGNFEAFLVSKV